jgi:hypothetical protein
MAGKRVLVADDLTPVLSAVAKILENHSMSLAW